MPQPKVARQRGPNGRFRSSHNTTPATGVQHPAGLFRLPPELRAAVYKALSSSNRKLTLRRPQDAKFRHAHITLFDNSILATCKTIHAEALPLFYASQTFHYCAELNGLLRQPAIPEAHLALAKHVSIEATVNSQSATKLDAVIAAHVQTIIRYCVRLSSFTLHVIPAAEPGSFNSSIRSLSLLPTTFSEGIAATQLKTLRPRLDRLSVVTFGGWDTLHHLREAIAEDKQWVEGVKCWKSWHGLQLTAAQLEAISVKQRNYRLAVWDDVVHPHSQCVRVFHANRPEVKRE